MAFLSVICTAVHQGLDHQIRHSLSAKDENGLQWLISIFDLNDTPAESIKMIDEFMCQPQGVEMLRQLGLDPVL